MRCSSCSAPIRPVVAVDIDGTLGNYHSHFHRFAVGYLNRRLPEGYDGARAFSEHLKLDKPTYREVKLAYRQGGLKRTMPAFDGAEEFMQDLRMLRVEVWIATTRPYLRLDNVDPDTREWLARHDMPYHHMLYDEDKYEQLVAYVDPERIVAVVEDLGEQCQRADGLGLEVWQPWRTHNQKDRRPQAHEFVGWKQVLDRIEEKTRAFA